MAVAVDTVTRLTRDVDHLAARVTSLETILVLREDNKRKFLSFVKSWRRSDQMKEISIKKFYIKKDFKICGDKSCHSRCYLQRLF